MSLFVSMVKENVFESNNEILACIKQIEEEDHMHLRRKNTQSISSYNNRKS